MEPYELPKEVTEIVELIEKFLKQEISDAELTELNHWVSAAAENKTLFESLTSAEKQQELMKQFYRSAQISNATERQANELVFGSAPVRKMYSSWWKAAIAAAAVMIIAIGVYFWHMQKVMTRPLPVAQHKLKTDVGPGKYKAMLTLADGSKVVLDSAATGKLADQGGTQILNNDGQLVYKRADINDKEVLYNTLSTSRGEMYPLTLSDGSKVWLNSASSIHYPVSFASNERRVTITGEAYFEVAKDAAKPFIVDVNGVDIRVLGTHFNIDAYGDNEKIRTTLLEGSVKIMPGPASKSEVLKPGQQAQVNNKGDISIVNNANLDKEIAWKNRTFIFNGDDVKTVMNRLSRWYDVEVVYKGAVPDLQFFGIINMDQPASGVLRALQAKDARFQIEGKKIIVSP